MDEDLFRHDIEFARDEGLQLLRHVGIEFETDDDAAAAPLQRGLEEKDEIFGFLLDFDFAVAHDAEQALPGDGISREETLGFHGDQGFKRDETRLARRQNLRQAHEAFNLGGQAHKRVEAPSVRLAHQGKRDAEAEVRNERERMGRINGDRCQHRENVQQKVIGDPVLLSPGEFTALEDLDLFAGEIGAQLTPAILLLGGEHGHTLADAEKLVGR